MDHCLPEFYIPRADAVTTQAYGSQDITRSRGLAHDLGRRVMDRDRGRILGRRRAN